MCNQCSLYFQVFIFSSKIVAQNWIGTSGPNTSIPVMAHINGIYQFDNKMMNADVNFVFSDFQTNYPDFAYFMPPPDIWCQVLKFFTTSKRRSTVITSKNSSKNLSNENKHWCFCCL